jgi:hypothetical protein
MFNHIKLFVKKGMGGFMNKNDSESSALKIIEKVQVELSEIEALCSDYILKERIRKLLEFVQSETPGYKITFSEMIYSKIQETKGLHSDLNLDFYLLYRNFVEGKTSTLEAQNLYEMYIKELKTR